MCACVHGSCIWLESWRIVCVSSCPRLDDGGNMGVGIFFDRSVFVWNEIPVQQTSLHKTGGGVSRQLVYVTGTQWRPAQCKHVPPQMEWRICGGLHDKRTKASQKWTLSLSCWTNDLLFSPHLKLLKQYLLFVFSSYVTDQGSAQSLVMQDSQSSFPCSGFGLISLPAT